MSNLSACDDLELRERARFLLVELDKTLKEIGPLLERLGRYRNELAIIEEELGTRNGSES